MPKPRPVFLVIAIVGGVPLVLATVFALMREQTSLAPPEAEYPCHDQVVPGWDELAWAKRTEASLEAPGSPADPREVPTAPTPTPGAEKSVPPKRFADLLSMPETTRAEIETKRERINITIQETSMPIFVQRFEAGHSEFISSEQSYSGLSQDDYELHGVQMVPGKGTYRTVLPRAEYPDLYELRDEASRLAKAAGQKLVEEAEAKRNQAQSATPR